MFDGLSANWQKERAESQMTLGKLIDRLTELPTDTVIKGFGDPHSYRGYYSDLAFSLSENDMTTSYAIEMCQKCMGEVFEGYKGGDFQMGRNTPVWIAEYGDCGKKIMAINDDGTIELGNDD